MNCIERKNLNSEWKNNCLEDDKMMELLKFVELPIIHFETNLVNHCNLNCGYCDHLSPLAEKWYADLDLFDQDFCRMADLFNGEARYIRLVGGEPLLHPKLTEFFRTARHYFRNANIELWTNGLLLNRQTKSFWESCKNERILINVTKYPISIDYAEMQSIAKKEGVPFRFFDDGKTVCCFNNNSFDKSGGQEPRSSFVKCDNANRHITLSQGGNLYTCDKVPHIGILNAAFGTIFHVSEKDYINIHSKNLTAEEIFRFLSRPIPFCRYCNVSQRKKLVKWKRSECDLKEWVF